MSPRWLIGALFMFVMFTIIANVIDAQSEPLIAGDEDVLGGSIQSSVTETQDPAGGISVFWNTSRSVGANLGRILTFDYGFFYEEDLDDDGNRVPNEFMIFRYLCLLPLGVIALWLALLFRQITLGS